MWLPLGPQGSRFRGRLSQPDTGGEFRNCDPPRGTGRWCPAALARGTVLHRGEPSPLHPSPALTRGSLLALGISQTSRESRGHPPVPHGRGIRGPAARAWEGDHGMRPAPWAGGWRALGPGTAGSAVLVSQSWSLPPGACARLGSCPECGACSGLAGPCPDSGGRASSGRGGRPLPATSIVPFPVHPWSPW